MPVTLQTLRAMFPNSNIYTDRNGQVVIQTAMSYHHEGRMQAMDQCKLCSTFVKAGEHLCVDCDREMEYQAEIRCMQFEAEIDDILDDSAKDRYEAMDQSEK